MSDITFRAAWRNPAEDVVRDAQGFWLRQGVAMTPEASGERPRQLCAAAYAEGEMVALSTAVPYFWAPLRTRFAYYRSLVAAEFRRQNIASRLCVYSYDLLQAWSRQNPEEKLMGLFIAFQSDEFKGHRHAPVAQQLGLQLPIVGYTQEGHHLRVVWFEHATIE